MLYAIYRKTGTITLPGPYGSAIASITYDTRDYLHRTVEADNFDEARAKARVLYPTFNIGVVQA